MGLSGGCFQGRYARVPVGSLGIRRRESVQGFALPLGGGRQGRVLLRGDEVGQRGFFGSGGRIAGSLGFDQQGLGLAVVPSGRGRVGVGLVQLRLGRLGIGEGLIVGLGRGGKRCDDQSCQNQESESLH